MNDVPGEVRELLERALDGAVPRSGGAFSDTVIRQARRARGRRRRTAVGAGVCAAALVGAAGLLGGLRTSEPAARLPSPADIHRAAALVRSYVPPGTLVHEGGLLSPSADKVGVMVGLKLDRDIRDGRMDVLVIEWERPNGGPTVCPSSSSCERIATGQGELTLERIVSPAGHPSVFGVTYQATLRRPGATTLVISDSKMVDHAVAGGGTPPPSPTQPATRLSREQMTHLSLAVSQAVPG